jgi:hypothetical protein
MTISRAGLALERLPGPGARCPARFRTAKQPEPYSMYAAQAADVLLDAIARSDGTRASVVRELFAARVHNGILGNFTVTPQGDTTARTMTIYRVAHPAFRPWQVITPPCEPAQVKLKRPAPARNRGRRPRRDPGARSENRNVYPPVVAASTSRERSVDQRGRHPPPPRHR